MSDNEFREAMPHIIKRIETGMDRLHAKSDRLAAKIDQKTDPLDTKIDPLDVKTDRKIERLDGAIKANRDAINRISTEVKSLKWMMGPGVPFTAALIRNRVGGPRFFLLKDQKPPTRFSTNFKPQQKLLELNLTKKRHVDLQRDNHTRCAFR